MGRQLKKGNRMATPVLIPKLVPVRQTRAKFEALRLGWPILVVGIIAVIMAIAPIQQRLAFALFIVQLIVSIVTIVFWIKKTPA